MPVPNPCSRLGYLNNGERWFVVQGRLKRRGDDVMAPPCNHVLDYTTSAILCQQSMRNGRQTSRPPSRPPAVASAWGRGGCFETSEVSKHPPLPHALVRAV